MKNKGKHPPGVSAVLFKLGNAVCVKMKEEGEVPFYRSLSFLLFNLKLVVKGDTSLYSIGRW